MAKYERCIEDLDDSEIETLKGVTYENLQVEFLGTWMDDHAQCVGVNINGVEVGFWWLSPEGAAALCYPDSPKARKIIIDILNSSIAG
jgi:hypothetical protein